MICPLMKIICVLFLSSILFSGCTTVNFEHPVPPDSEITINVSLGGWKTNVGHENSLEQKTDAKLPVYPMGSENSVESEK